MKIFYSLKSKLHNPVYEIDNNGKKVPHQEIPERVEVIVEELRRNNFHLDEVNLKIPSKMLFRVHDKDFVNYVKKTSSNMKKGEVLHCDIALDTYTPLMNETYNSAIAGASVAYKAAQYLQSRNARVVYALCRPPGHHAFSYQMGGYCYFNNEAIATEYLSGFGKVAVLDVDFHHGNGLQEIFYERDDVLYISIHADPDFKFPYFWGHKNERGKGKGIGFNINYPLPLGTKNDSYQRTLNKALSDIKKFGPKFLVISLGFDTYKDDPIGGFKLTTDYYQKMARTIKTLGLPTVIVQEGGYDVNSLGRNVVSFLKGYSI